MKATDAHHIEQSPEFIGGNTLTYSARRVLVGSCPRCEVPLVVFNDYESWPLVGCACGWHGDALSLRDTMLYATGEAARLLDAPR